MAVNHTMEKFLDNLRASRVECEYEGYIDFITLNESDQRELLFGALLRLTLKIEGLEKELARLR